MSRPAFEGRSGGPPSLLFRLLFAGFLSLAPATFESRLDIERPAVVLALGEPTPGLGR